MKIISLVIKLIFFLLPCINARELYPMEFTKKTLSPKILLANYYSKPALPFSNHQSIVCLDTLGDEIYQRYKGTPSKYNIMSLDNELALSPSEINALTGHQELHKKLRLDENLELALEERNSDKVLFLQKCGVTLDQSLDNALKADNEAKALFLIKHGAKPSAKTLYENPECIDFVHEQGIKIDTETLNKALENHLRGYPLNIGLIEKLFTLGATLAGITTKSPSLFEEIRTGYFQDNRDFLDTISRHIKDTTLANSILKRVIDITGPNATLNFIQNTGLNQGSISQENKLKLAHLLKNYITNTRGKYGGKNIDTIINTIKRFLSLGIDQEDLENNHTMFYYLCNHATKNTYTPTFFDFFKPYLNDRNMVNDFLHETAYYYPEGIVRAYQYGIQFDKNDLSKAIKSIATGEKSHTINRLSIIKELIERGGDPAALDEQGKTLFAYCRDIALEDKFEDFCKNNIKTPRARKDLLLCCNTNIKIFKHIDSFMHFTHDDVSQEEKTTLKELLSFTAILDPYNDTLKRIVELGVNPDDPNDSDILLLCSGKGSLTELLKYMFDTLQIKYSKKTVSEAFKYALKKAPINCPTLFYKGGADASSLDDKGRTVWYYGYDSFYNWSGEQRCERFFSFFVDAFKNNRSVLRDFLLRRYNRDHTKLDNPQHNKDIVFVSHAFNTEIGKLALCDALQEIVKEYRKNEVQKKYDHYSVTTFDIKKIKDLVKNFKADPLQLDDCGKTIFYYCSKEALEDHAFLEFFEKYKSNQKAQLDFKQCQYHRSDTGKAMTLLLLLNWLKTKKTGNSIMIPAQLKKIIFKFAFNDQELIKIKYSK